MSGVVAYRFRRDESDDWHFDTAEGLPYKDRITLIEAGWSVEPLTLLPLGCECPPSATGFDYDCPVHGGGESS